MDVNVKSPTFWSWGSLFKAATQKTPESFTAPISGTQGAEERHKGDCHFWDVALWGSCHNNMTLWCRSTTFEQMVAGLKRDPHDQNNRS